MKDEEMVAHYARTDGGSLGVIRPANSGERVGMA
jgi:hypothetical protein